MTSPSQQTLAGHFLIAMPSLADPPFSRGVAFVCQHDEDGAVGLLINQLSEYRLGDVLAQMKLGCSDIELADAPVLIGGPVQQERGFVLHREHGHWESSYRVNADWSERRLDLASVRVDQSPLTFPENGRAAEAHPRQQGLFVVVAEALDSARAAQNTVRGGGRPDGPA